MEKQQSEMQAKMAEEMSKFGTGGANAFQRKESYSIIMSEFGSGEGKGFQRKESYMR
jgi:hypothetical protein